MSRSIHESHSDASRTTRRPGIVPAPSRRVRDQAGAASAEYAAVTAAGVGFAGILIKLLTSDFGRNLLQKILEAFLSMVGIG